MTLVHRRVRSVLPTGFRTVEVNAPWKQHKVPEGLSLPRASHSGLIGRLPASCPHTEGRGKVLQSSTQDNPQDIASPSCTTWHTHTASGCDPSEQPDPPADPTRTRHS